MSKFNKLHIHFGETKDAIIKYKRQDIQELSKKFEVEAKNKIESDKKKIKKKKFILKERDVYNKEQVILTLQLEPNIYQEYKSSNNYLKNLNKLILENEKKKFDELDNIDKEKTMENKIYNERVKKEETEIFQLLYHFKEYYFRQFHFFYDYPYKKVKLQISCFKENEELRDNPFESDYLENDYLSVYKEIKLLSIKNLQRYDCWQDKSPQEWIDYCKLQNRENDGRSPTYYEGSYLLSPVKVDFYDEEQMKFQVTFTKFKDSKKFVQRLAIHFYDEDFSEWKYRKFLCEQRRDKIDDLILLTRYIDNVPLNLISVLSEKTVEKIRKYLLFEKPNLIKKYNNLFKSNQSINSINHNKSIYEDMEEKSNPGENSQFDNRTYTKYDNQIKIVSQDYIRQMRKCRFLIELQELSNLKLFFHRNIKHINFFTQTKTPKHGLVYEDYTKSNYKTFKNKVNFFNNKSFFENKLLSELKEDFLIMCEKFKKLKILLYDFEIKLPIEKKAFQELNNKYNEKSYDTLLSICKHNLKNTITEKLKNSGIDKKGNSPFQISEFEIYQKSQIRKVLNFFNLILRTKLEELARSRIMSFINFIIKFSECSYEKERYFTESPTPLFIISIEIDNSNKFIFKESIQEYKESILQAYSHIIKVFSEIKDLMSLCIKPLTLNDKIVFEIDKDYDLYVEGLNIIEKIFEISEKEAENVKDNYNKYKDIIKSKSDYFIQSKLKKREISTLDDVNICKKMLEDFYIFKKELKLMPSEINQRMFCIKTTNITDAICKKIDQIKSDLTSNYMMNYSNKCISALEENAGLRIKMLGKKPESIEEYEDLNKLIFDTTSFVNQKKVELNNIEQIYIILEKTYNSFDKKSFFTFIEKWRLPNKVEDAKKEGLKFISDVGIELEEKLHNVMLKFKNDVSELVANFEVVKSFDSFIGYVTLNDVGKLGFDSNSWFKIREFEGNLQQLKNIKEEIVRNMMILYPDRKAMIEAGDEDLQEFDIIKNIDKDFEAYYMLWKTALDVFNYQQIIQNPISSISANTNIKITDEKFDFIENLTKYYKIVDSVNKKIGINDLTIAKLSNQLIENIRVYESYCWIVANLKSGFLKQDDFEQICKLLEIIPSEQSELMSFTLEQLKNEKNIDSIRADIEGIKSRASRRAIFLNEIKILQQEFLLFEITYKVVGEKTKITDIDVLQQKLDEQTNKLQLILGNPVTQSDNKLKIEARQYNDKIKNIQNILEEIIKFQSSYWYLQPILDSGEVNKELAYEKRLFDKIDEFWKKTIVENLEDPNLNLFIEKDLNGTLLKSLLDNNKSVAEIIYNLIRYLNTKRQLFPRFYFVSDEDLMKILAQTKDPTLIQAHLSKCFEGINRVTFDSRNEIISEMISSDGEVVSLDKTINVNEDICKGKVEVWLKILEDEMIKTLKIISYNCREDFCEKLKLNKKRIDWLQSNWPGQIVQIIDQEVWTSEVEKSIISSEKEISNYLSRLNSELRDVVDLIRTNIPISLSISLSALIVISVHNKDIVEKLIKNKVHEISDFEWISYMRYEWDNRWDPEKHIEKCPLKVKMVTSSLNYGFEYLGNVSRLVITNLTDRCFRTLFGAYQVKYGGAPEGPAGTGKTESVKDLSKCVGTKCNVFNCTEGINTLAMSKFFKGLCSSGCWCCFDEFNRIDTEVLSVIAQQILTIQDALKLGLTEFVFDESEEIKLRDTCAINITMNPSYSGRNDLPDNLKALFRPCAMMVADYYLIAQIKLYSFGFQNSKILADKVVSSLKLSSEQLSTQAHYDFGMRSLNAILVAAGKLKKEDPEMDEERIALRALIDVNLPKFTSNDIPLFEGIIGDLFPTTERIIVNYTEIKSGLENSCVDLNLQSNPNFLKKCIQLYETMNVRHALMIVGQQCLGKSKIIKVLQKTFNSYLDISKYGVVESHILNPKSILQKQLYGYFHPTSKEWMKGLLQVKMLDLVEKEKNINKWLIFDGPVDTLWIENMNSLLDDNKKLCLDDSSSIPLGYKMNIIFEVDDLKEASPATVSRNGMVLCENETIKYTDLIVSYSNDLPKIFHRSEDNFKSYFVSTINHILYPCIKYIYSNAKESFGIPIDINHITQSVLQIFDCFMIDYKMRDLQKEEITLKESEKMTNEKIENMIYFSIIISLFGILKRSSPLKVNEFIQDISLGVDISKKYPFLSNILESDEYGLLTGSNKKWIPKKIGSKINEIKDINDYAYILYENKWKSWSEIQGTFSINPELSFNEIIIPTSETIKISYLIGFTAPSKKNILFTGNTGTGKTLTIVNTLVNNFENDLYTFIKMSFTAQTTTELTQNLIESKLSKSYRRFSPSKSRKGVLFIDDLNMPEREKFGAQPPIELLRQWLDYEGWYDLISDNKDFIKISDISLVSAMGSISSGRTVSSRFLRHSIIQFCDSYQYLTMYKIFDSFMTWFFLKNPNMETRILNMKEGLIEATIKLYLSCNTMFKATPAKTHYLFNLRDVSRVFQGISKASYRSIKDELDFTKLWIHESQRVFSDRLINEEDKQVFEGLMSDVMKKELKRDYSIFSNKTILFGNFIPTIPNEDPNKPLLEGLYCELSNMNKIKSCLQERLLLYNEDIKNRDSSGSAMNLVFFPYAIEHILRISRILSTENGNALLVGIGGSGRKSLTMLTCSIYSYIPFQIENAADLKDSELRDKIKENLLKEKAMQGKETVWIISDTQINSESQVEDINSFLNNGEIPNIINQDDINYIKEYIQTQDKLMLKKPNSETEFINIFIELCKQNIHVVLCLSPIGEQFRKRVMKFPSLVNCTNIDWFLKWPEQALSEVATYYLSSTDGLNFEESVLSSITKICVDMQTRVSKYTIKFRQELKRYYYITPMSFLQLLNLFIKLYRDTDKKINEEINRYKNGMLILAQAEKTSAEMLEYINNHLQPKLKEEKSKGEEKAKFLFELSEKLKKDEEEGRKKKEEAQIAKKESDEKNLIANEQLREIELMKDTAKKKLDELKQDEVMQLKRSKDDKYIAEYCRFLCLLMVSPPHPKPKKVDPKLPPVMDYFNHAGTVLNKGDFLNTLKKFDSRNMNPETAEELKNELEKSTFEPEKKSQTLKNLFEIIKIHSSIYWINKKYLPAKEMAESANKEAKDAEDSLKRITDSLTELHRIQKEKEEERIETELKIKQLEHNLNTCKDRLDNAVKLVNNLSVEKKNWQHKLEVLESGKITLMGDILISAGIIAYLGAFNKAYRNEIISEWNKLILQYQIPITKENIDVILQKTLSNSYEIDIWKSKKLPNDNFSVDNAIIMSKSQRYCLLIDPQNQANEWLNETYKAVEIDKKKTKGSNNHHQNEIFYIVRPTTEENELVKRVTESLERGGVILYENATEQLNSLLMPIFRKEFFYEGRDKLVSFNGTKVMVHNDFNMYVTTKIAKPHYLPEICVAFTLVNFTVTEDGLEDQMLNFLVEKDAADLDLKRKEGNKRMNELNYEKRINEQIILDKLNTYSDKEDKAVILDDKELIATLESSKLKAEEAEYTIQKTKEQDVIIEKTRVSYKPVSTHVSQLFFTISDLPNIEPVYQYSLNWFKRIFSLVIERMQEVKFNKNENEKKNSFLKDEFTSLLYDKICLSLFEKDKLVFSFMLYSKIIQMSLNEQQKEVFNKEIRFLVTGGSGVEFTYTNPSENDGGWISKSAWNSICELSKLSNTFKDIRESFSDAYKEWKTIFSSENPVSFDFPSQFNKLSHFHKLLIVRILSPDKIVPEIKTLILSSIGEKYIKAPEFDIMKVYHESRSSIPILFILSPGADPIVIIEKLANLVGKNWQEECKKLSLGQGQTENAKRKISNGIEKQKWIILQNCHLAKSFMDELEKEIEVFPDDPNSDFRLFLTASPSDVIPLSIIQNSIKLTNEPPRGIKQSLVRSFSSFDEKFYETSKKVNLCKKFIYSYCFFHALILERRKYGPLGWNIPYEFSGGDLSISLNQMKLFLNEYNDIQWEAMWYMVAEANYGGRVTDPSDRVLINVLFKTLCNSNMMNNDFYFNNIKDYPLPSDLKYDEMIRYINNNVPIEDKPSIFGMHGNADITFAINETNQLLSTSLLTLPRQISSKDGHSIEEQVKERAMFVKEKLPSRFDIDKIRSLHPVMHSESLNSVLHQEVMRYNNLISKVTSIMTNIIDAVNGDAIMTNELEGIVLKIYDNKTPTQIEKVAYPSLKPFSSWINDLIDKLSFIKKWIDEGIPTSFWISGFFFTQSFLTGVLQNYARKKKLPIDELAWDFEIMNNPKKYDLSNSPDEGCYTYGFFIEGASWDMENNYITEPIPKVLYPTMPYIWFKPIKKDDLNRSKTYICPVYRTSKRAGELNTSGQSTNFLISICKLLIIICNYM